MTAGYFPVDLERAAGVAMFDNPDALGAYLVICAGVNGQSSTRVSTWGALAVAKRLGLSYRQASNAIAILVGAGYLIDESEGKKARYRLMQLGERVIYLPMTLIDGVGHGTPPLQRLQKEAPASFFSSRAGARLDGLMVMLNLYECFDLGAFGGVDPGKASVNWEVVDTQPATPIELIEIAEGNMTASKKFIERSLPHVQENRSVRFWSALRLLEKADLVYQTLVIYEDDEPLATLYVKDWHARQAEPYLLQEVHKTCQRLGIFESEWDGTGEPALDGIVSNGIDTGQFRFLRPTGSNVEVQGVYRLRFKAQTRDTVIGQQQEHDRNRLATEALQGLTLENQ